MLVCSTVVLGFISPLSAISPIYQRELRERDKCSCSMNVPASFPGPGEFLSLDFLLCRCSSSRSGLGSARAFPSAWSLLCPC